MTDGQFKVDFASQSLEFTGERMTPAVSGEVAIEHYHRYCIARDVCAGFDVLDVASGEGYGSAILAGVANTVVGVEIDRSSVHHSRENYKKSNLRFLEGSALSLPVADKSIDVAVSFETLEHIREHENFVAELKRVMRPGGRLIISTPDRTVYSARGLPSNKYHLRELTEAEFRKLLSSNFENVLLLRQRAVVASLAVVAEGAASWRSYDERGADCIEASDGLARAPYLIAVASDFELPPIFSSGYMDRKGVDEVYSRVEHRSFDENSSKRSGDADSVIYDPLGFIVADSRGDVDTEGGAEAEVVGEQVALPDTSDIDKPDTNDASIDNRQLQAERDRLLSVCAEKDVLISRLRENEIELMQTVKAMKRALAEAARAPAETFRGSVGSP